jgi:hypothetical protein
MWTSLFRNHADNAWMVGAGSRSILTVPSPTLVASASWTRRHSASTSSSGRSVGDEMTTRMRSAPSTVSGRGGCGTSR